MTSYLPTSDIRSSAQPARRERKRSQKYDNWRTVKPGQLNQLHALGECLWPPCPNGDRYCRCTPLDGCADKVVPADASKRKVEKFSKRELFQAAKSGALDRRSCSCCWCCSNDRRRRGSKPWRINGGGHVHGEEFWRVGDWKDDMRSEDCEIFDYELPYDNHPYVTSTYDEPLWELHITRIVSLGDFFFGADGNVLGKEQFAETDDDEWSIVSSDSYDDVWSVESGDENWGVESVYETQRVLSTW